MTIQVQPPDAQRRITGNACGTVELQNRYVVKVHLFKIKGASKLKRPAAHPERSAFGGQRAVRVQTQGAVVGQQHVLGAEFQTGAVQLQVAACHARALCQGHASSGRLQTGVVQRQRVAEHQHTAAGL